MNKQLSLTQKYACNAKLFLEVCDHAVYVSSKYYLRWINRGSVWKVMHKPLSWTSLENFFIFAWPLIHYLYFSNTHKNCIAVKIHLYKYRGWVIKRAGVLRMPLHHPCGPPFLLQILICQLTCKTTLRCQLPYSPLPSSRSNPWSAFLKRRDSMVFINALCAIHQGWLTAQQEEK